MSRIRLTPRRADLLAVAVALALSLLAVLCAPADARPSRVVAIGGSLTEIVYALGEQHRLIGVDSTSKHPAEATALPDVGYMRALAAEGVLSLDPDLILAIEGAGPPPVVEVLKAASVAYVEVTEAYSAEGILAKIDAVGAALGVADKAAALKRVVAAEMAATAKAVATTARPRVLYLLSAGGGRLTAAGAGTPADAVIAMAGGRNVFAFEGYKPVGAEAMIAAAPDVIVAMTRTGSDPTEAIRALAGIELTPAGRDGRIVAMDGLYLLGFGPRTARAVADLARALGTIE